MSPLPESLPPRPLVFYALAICAVALGYSFYTEQIWEDSLIALRVAENFVDGHGLSYHPDERVQACSSPIGVLMLAWCYLLTGKTSYLATIWLYRVFSIAALAGSGVVLLQGTARAVPRWTPALWWLALVYLFDAKSIAFSTNGMETAYPLLFLAWAIYLLSPPQSERWLAQGLCWAGLMWSRPDGCVYIAALALAQLIFSGLPRSIVARSLVKSAAVASLVYGPWFFWAWSYYGSPVPNTVLAKSNPDGLMAQFHAMLANFATQFFGAAAMTFRPIYAHLGQWLENPIAQQSFAALTMCLAIFCAFYWLIPTQDRLGRMTSFSFAMLCVFFSFEGSVYPWYLPPATMLGLVTLARAFAALVEAIRRTAPTLSRSLLLRLAVGSLVGLACCQILVFGLAAWELRIQQAEIEMGTRARIGAWLREHGQPGDTVYLEPLGYIGYLSGLKVRDYPGLVSPEVVRLRNELKLGWIRILFATKPNWVVARGSEVWSVMNSPLGPEFQREYELVQVFDALPRLNSYTFLPGRAYLNYDAQFAIFHRKASAAKNP